MSGKRIKQIIPMIVCLISFFGGIAVAFFGQYIENDAVMLFGFGISMLGTAAGIVAQKIIDKKETGSAAKSGFKLPDREKYVPLLLDERIKQAPEIQRLLQYPEVQRVFFDPSFLNSDEAERSAYVRELLEILDGMLNSRVTSGISSQYQNQGDPVINPAKANIGVIEQNETPNEYGRSSMTDSEAERFENMRKAPRRKLGKVLNVIGICMFVLPFAAVFAFAFIFNGKTVSLNMDMMSVFCTLIPIGFFVTLLGGILKK